MDSEKKKTLVVGALFVVMLGIGAFQFTKGGEAAPAPEAANDAAKPEDGKKSEEKSAGAKNPIYALGLTTRDPFRPAAFSVSKTEAAAPVAPAPAPEPRLNGRSIPMPTPMEGGLVPMPPGDASGGLPGPGGLPPVEESAPPPKPRFRGTLIGVVVGAQSAAVFRFGDSQRIVTVGSSIDPDTRLLSVTPRRALVRFHGETIAIHLKDEAPAASSSSAPAPKSAPAPTPETASGTPDPTETSHD